MPTRIKICGITRVQDGLAAARAGADAIGLVFAERSPRRVGLELACEIVQALPPFVTTVALFVNAGMATVAEVVHRLHPGCLQFHGEETPAYCASFGLPWLKAVRVRPGVDLIQFAALHADAQGLLLDAFNPAAHGGTGESFDWRLIPVGLSRPVVLAGGLTTVNVADAVRLVRPWAVDVSSGVESAPGIKDAAAIAAFVNEIRQVDVQLSR
ncbi:MAG TPA: phosphoribosylanthranilate isomerase [Thiobacillaceae bacterium]|nr:phosphoribosylanthranilate isomerase [Thiobacillaceae bacterium]HNU65155.1 phosphoribosylanthranilate isomerase [Thiobacillaceae bacterium]